MSSSDYEDKCSFFMNHEVHLIKVESFITRSPYPALFIFQLWIDHEAESKQFHLAITLSRNFFKLTAK